MSKRFFMIGAQRWSVEVTPDSAWTGHESGSCEPLKQEIKIREAHRDTMRDTLLHEIIHASLAVAGVAEDLHDDQEEKVVRALAPVLDQVLIWRVRGMK